MAKKNPKDKYSEIDQVIDSETFIECIKDGFKDIEDPREPDSSYPLASLLVIILCAIIAGANAITHIHEYAEMKIGLFQRLLTEGLWKAKFKNHPAKRSGKCLTKSLPPTIASIGS